MAAQINLKKYCLLSFKSIPIENEVIWFFKSPDEYFSVEAIVAKFGGDDRDDANASFSTCKSKKFLVFA